MLQIQFVHCQFMKLIVSCEICYCLFLPGEYGERVTETSDYLSGGGWVDIFEGYWVTEGVG